jgi:eukaryotic-like serine/threonine-protein kinase
MSLREQLQQTLGTAYTLERELGGGGMSRVFVAEETALRRKVVVKVLPPEVAAGVNADRFKREIQLAARLQHPHIVPLLSAGEMNGVPYYTMPFVEGESIRARLARTGAMSITEVIGVLRDVAKALSYAHERGIVHRDIKPDNVLLSGDSATVADFGIAKAIAAARTDGGTVGATLTSIGASIGTPAYMAPEQAAADPSTNHRADIYAFGCMAYELLAGRPPFVATTPQRLLAAHMSDDPDPILQYRADTPPQLAELVMRCLVKDADDRPQSARELVGVIDTVTSGGGHPALPSVLIGGAGMVRKALLAYAAAFVFVAVLAKAAIVAIGLPDWVFPGALVVMALGLPVILFTAYVHHTTRKLVTQTPTYTPGGTPAASTHGTMATFAMRASPHVSWRRTWMGGVFAVGAFVTLIGAYMALRALGIGPFGSLFAAGALDRNEKLLVADFTNTSSDTTIGAVVTEAFRTALGQSRSVGVFQSTQMRDVLRRMQKPLDTKVDFAVAREIASREGLKAVVLGDVISFGGSYVVSVRLLSPQTGEELASFRENAKSDAELLSTIDKLARDLRARIGESLRTVQAALPLERVTTPSLEALKKYVQGNRLTIIQGDFTKAEALLQEAIALDTAFAMAYRKLAVEYNNRAQFDKSMPLLQKAFDHRDRLSDAERYIVMGSYYFAGPHQDIDKSTSAYESLLEIQPDFVTALNNVAINYRFQRNFAKAEESLERAVALPQPPVVAFNQLIWTKWALGKKAEAWQVMARFDSTFPTTGQRFARRSELLYSERRFDSASTVMHARLREPSVELGARAGVNNILARVARTQGKLRESERFAALALGFDQQRGAREAALTHAVNQATARMVFLDDKRTANTILDRATAETQLDRLPASVRPYIDLSLAYGLAGRAAELREVGASYERSRREIQTYVDPIERSVIKGSLALAERRYDDAAAEFRAADKGECESCALPMLAMSYDLAGKEDSALAVYQRYVNTNDINRYLVDHFFLAGSFKRLGELYEARGDKQNALANYLQFTEIWKDADPELQSKVAEVKARIARLRDTERR